MRARRRPHCVVERERGHRSIAACQAVAGPSVSLGAHHLGRRQRTVPSYGRCGYVCDPHPSVWVGVRRRWWREGRCLCTARCCGGGPECDATDMHCRHQEEQRRRLWRSSCLVAHPTTTNHRHTPGGEAGRMHVRSPHAERRGVGAHRCRRRGGDAQPMEERVRERYDRGLAERSGSRGGCRHVSGETPRRQACEQSHDARCGRRVWREWTRSAWAVGPITVHCSAQTHSSLHLHAPLSAATCTSLPIYDGGVGDVQHTRGT